MKIPLMRKSNILSSLAVGSAGILSIYFGAKWKSRWTAAGFSNSCAAGSDAVQHDVRNVLKWPNILRVNAAEKSESIALSQIQAVPSVESSKERQAKRIVPWHFENPPTRQMLNNSEGGPVKLTLYQYVTCPFCCKVRAYLDYHGINYNIVEVDSIRRTQKKWTSYGKVPVLVIDGAGADGFVQLNDSSMIVSVLNSQKVNGQQSSLERMLSYYPVIESREGKKTLYEYPNKYFIMLGDRRPGKELAELREEREWRQWVDDNLVHILSPNAYRTLSEAIESFRWFSKVGDWETCMSGWSRLVCIYSGAFVMWAIGGRLKRKYDLDDDVRKSLYNSINDWLAGIGPSRKFMGGDKPNLADLAVYGVMCSIEGCQAFKDLCDNTDFLSWYTPMKKAVVEHHGHPSLEVKATVK